MEAYRYYDENAKILTSGEVSKSYNQLWLMRYVQAVFDSQELTRSKIEDLGYKKIDEYDFNGVVVWKYTR
jgi:S-adenosylmethionine synthetase